MYQIGEVSEKADVSTQAIRYYERIGVLPEARRSRNGYRIYDDNDVDRLRFVRSARALDFSLDDIQEILELRDQGMAPCTYVMGLMHEQITAIDDRIRQLQRLRGDLRRLHRAGLQMPDDVRMKECVCHLIESTGDEPNQT